MLSPTQTSNGAVILYRPKQGAVSLHVQLSGETVWLTQKQMAQLFGVDVRTINYHILQIFRSAELKPKSVVAKFATTASDGKTYQVEYFNLDMIISVGYRVNGKQGTQFRIWASSVLKQHLIRGYTLDKKKLQAYVERNKKLQDKRIKELEKFGQTLALVRSTVDQKQLSGDEAKGLLHVITDYAKSWATLQQFDEGTLPTHVRTTKKIRDLEEKEAERAIVTLARQLAKKGEAGDLFAREQRPGGMRSILRNIHQTFDGKPVYMSVEERAAHLLYFTIKDHPFIDGNKRIGALLFLLFLKRHGRLTTKSGTAVITDAALVALALLIAQSKPAEKETMITLVQNLL